MNLQILHTSDTHGYIYPYHYATKEEKKHGLAKLQTLLKKIRKEHSLLIDTGDTIQGSPLAYYHQLKLGNQINPMAKALNAMNYNYIAIGNHEFNFGKPYLMHYLNDLKPTILNANLLHTDGIPIAGKPYEIITLDGIKIAIIGATTHYIPNWEQPSHIEGMEILDAFETTKKYVEELRPSVDFIIVNYHGGFERNFDTFMLDVDDTGENQGSKMLREIDGVDILLTGHQHRSLLGTKFDTFYSQPGFNAQQVNEINIEFSKENDELRYFITSKTHLISDEEPDPEILAVASIEEAQTQTYLDTPVGYLDKPLLIRDQLEARLHKHPLISFINQVQLEYTKADLAICSLGNDVSGFNQEITIRDVLGTYIFPNTIVVKELTGKELRLALEKTAEFFEYKNDKIVISEKFNSPKLQLYAYDMYDGIEYTLDIRKPIGKRVTSLTYQNEEVTESMTFSVAMNNYRASGGGDYTFIKDCPTIQDTQKEVVSLLIDYIIQEKEIIIDHVNNIKIL